MDIDDLFKGSKGFVGPRFKSLKCLIEQLMPKKDNDGGTVISTSKTVVTKDSSLNYWPYSAEKGGTIVTDKRKGGAVNIKVKQKR